MNKWESPIRGFEDVIQELKRDQTSLVSNNDELTVRSLKLIVENKLLN